MYCGVYRLDEHTLPAESLTFVQMQSMGKVSLRLHAVFQFKRATLSMIK